ncbi:hypothetical protein IPG36_03350 [bacterium]|nr:MAG: hypothetical protein IPG36_03350 [bacterium]
MEFLLRLIQPPPIQHRAHTGRQIQTRPPGCIGKLTVAVTRCRSRVKAPVARSNAIQHGQLKIWNILTFSAATTGAGSVRFTLLLATARSRRTPHYFPTPQVKARPSPARRQLHGRRYPDDSPPLPVP